MSWLSENGLALYGAVTGTAALIIGYFGHRHNIRKDKIKLSISYEPHPSQAENLKDMVSSERKEPWEQRTLTEVYLVTVRNLGSIPAPLDDVGVFTAEGTKKHALVPMRYGQINALRKVADAGFEALEPRAMRTFSVYLHRDEKMFSVSKGYAVDQTGKSWTSAKS